MHRWLLMLAAGHGLLAVGLGAFGAHGLQTRWAAYADAAKRLHWWSTAAHYQLTHALALGLVALLARNASEPSGSLALRIAGLAFAAGICIFSGSLYAMGLTGARWLGAITPFGGGLLIIGWAALLFYAAALPSG